MRFLLDSCANNRYKMYKSIYRFIIVSILFSLISCGENPSKYVGDSDRTKSGVITGKVVDSSSGESLSNVKILIEDIMAGSAFLDSTITNNAGEFSVLNLYEQEYYLQFCTKGYKPKTILLNVEDTLRLSEPIELDRNRYPYEYFSVEEFPTEPKGNGSYYSLDPDIFTNDRSWAIAYNDSHFLVEKIHRKLDSISISLIRNDFNVDSLWYKFFQHKCGALLVEDKSDLVVKLKGPDDHITSSGFIPYDFDISVWLDCVNDTSKMFTRYFFFEN